LPNSVVRLSKPVGGRLAVLHHLHHLHHLLLLLLGREI